MKKANLFQLAENKSEHRTLLKLVLKMGIRIISVLVARKRHSFLSNTGVELLTLMIIY